MQNVSAFERGYILFRNRMTMTPAIILISNDVRKSMEAAISVPMVQCLMDDGFLSPEPHRWTMQVTHGFLKKDARFIRNPNWKPQINDMIYALQSRS